MGLIPDPVIMNLKIYEKDFIDIITINLVFLKCELDREKIF